MNQRHGELLQNAHAKRLCWFCRHFSCTIGDAEDWSDVTPADRTKISCDAWGGDGRNHYGRQFGDSVPVLAEVGAKALRMADECPDFELAKLPPSAADLPAGSVLAIGSVIGSSFESRPVLGSPIRSHTFVEKPKREP